MIKADSNTGEVVRRGTGVDLIVEVAMIGNALGSTLPASLHEDSKNAFLIGLASESEEEMAAKLSASIIAHKDGKRVTSKADKKVVPESMDKALDVIIEAMMKAIGEEIGN